MHKFNLATVVIVCLISTAIITSAHPVILGSTSLSTQGVINDVEHVPGGLKLKYSASFETVTRSGTRPAGSLNLGNDLNDVFMDNLWYFEHSQSGSPEETNWIEGLELNTGIGGHKSARSIALQTGTGTMAGKRVEFNIMNLENHLGALNGKEMYISKWIYFPPGWDLPSGCSWISLGSTIEGSGTSTPQIGSQIWKQTTSPRYWATVAMSSPSYKYVSVPLGDTLPTGVWWQLEVYVYFSQTNGIYTAWFNGIKVEARGWQTLSSDGSMYSDVFKNYHEDVASVCTIFFDDLEIYGT